VVFVTVQNLIGIDALVFLRVWSENACSRHKFSFWAILPHKWDHSHRDLPKAPPLPMGDLDFGPPESSTETSSRSVQPFLHSSVLTAECPHTLQWAALPPQNCPFIWTIDLHLIHDSLGPSKPTTETFFDRFNRFCTGSAVCAYRPTLQRAAFPLRIAPSHGWTWTPRITHGSLGPSKSPF